jgi:hypothetical protein
MTEVLAGRDDEIIQYGYTKHNENDGMMVSRGRGL